MMGMESSAIHHAMVPRSERVCMRARKAQRAPVAQTRKATTAQKEMEESHSMATKVFWSGGGGNRK